MKNISTLILSLLFLSSIAQNNFEPEGSGVFASREFPEFVTDSIYNYQWNENTSTWDLQTKTGDMSYHMYRLTSEIEYNKVGFEWQRSIFHTYAYNDQGLLETDLTMTYADSVWQNNYIVKQIWDAAGNMTSQNIQVWNGISWIDQQRIVMTYDANHNMLTWLLQNNNGGWINISRKTFTYTNNNLTEEIAERWQDPSWVNQNRKQYTYENNRLVTLIEQSWSNNAWGNDLKSTNTYDNEGNLINTMAQMLENGNWINRFNSNYTYTSNRLMQWIYQDWDGSAWIDSQQELHAYDYNGNHTYCLNQIVKGDSWKDISMDRWGYNGSNYLTQTSHKIFDAENIYGDSTSYFLRSVLGFKENQADGVAIYPNPTSGKVIIKSDIIPTSIEVYSLNGNLLSTPVAGRIIDLGNIPAGTYIIRAIYGNKMISKVLIRL